LFPSVSRAQVPVFEITHADSSIKFNVRASVSIARTFDKWKSSLKFASPDLTSAVLDIKIQAALFAVATRKPRKNMLRKYTTIAE
jgi:hypothetical protein